jgi:photosystem II stability/assembly factor-like uncharacterized protein
MGVSFSDQNTGTAVGVNGTILRTTDGGTNWFPQASGITDWFNSVCFTDANTGTVVSASGKILRTTDGGTTWTLQTSPAYSNFWSVCFTDADNGTAVGSEGKIVRTTNGGTTWSLQSSGTTVWLNRVSFTDPDNGTVVGDYGTILRTTNGGINWINQSIATSDALWGVSFTDANTGTVVGAGGIILRTTNGGASWVSQTSGIMNFFYGGVSFTDTNNGTAVGDNGAIIRTSDGGTTWTIQTYGTTNILYGVSFTDANYGTAVGDNGMILRTTNGGMPVELTFFTASYGYNAVNLNWMTATEINNQGFEIQKQGSNKHSTISSWGKIGFVQGFGTTTEPKSYSFKDNDITTGTYKYRLKQIDFNGSFKYSNEIEVAVDFAQKEFVLYQNYPNPFNPSTTIKYTIPPVASGFSLSKVTLKVYDVLGNEVATLVNEEKKPGVYEVEFDGSGLSSFVSAKGGYASGVYFYQLKAVPILPGSRQAGDPSTGSGRAFIQTRKMILNK